MAYNPTRLGRVEIAKQTTWGTAASTGFLLMEVEPPTPPVTREMIERTAVRGGHYVLPPVSGARGDIEVSLKGPLTGWSASTPTGNPTDSPWGIVFQSLLGSSLVGGYAASAVGSGSTTTQIMISNSVPSSTYSVGQAILVTDGSKYYSAWLDNVTDGGASDHTLDLINTLPASPSSGTATYGSQTLSQSTDDPTFYTLRIRSLQSTSGLVLEGCVTRSITLTLDPRGQLVCEATVRVHSVSTYSAGSLANDAYTYPVLPAMTATGGARLAVNGSNIAAQSLQVTLEQELAPRLDHNDVEGLAGYVCTKRSARAEVTELLAGTPRIDIDTTTPVVDMQAGNTPGAVFALLVPAATMVEVGELGDSDGVVSQQRIYEAGRYVDAGGGSAPAGTPFRVALL